MLLFVDCDSTLVLWDDERQNHDKTLWVRDAWLPNDMLIAAVKAYLKERSDISLVVWSGGGKDYAESWARRFFPDDEWIAVAKDISLPREGDIVVDDEELATAGLNMSPNRFVEDYFEMRG